MASEGSEGAATRVTHEQLQRQLQRPRVDDLTSDTGSSVIEVSQESPEVVMIGDGPAKIPLIRAIDITGRWKHKLHQFTESGNTGTMKPPVIAIRPDGHVMAIFDENLLTQNASYSRIDFIKRLRQCLKIK